MVGCNRVDFIVGRSKCGSPVGCRNRKHPGEKKVSEVDEQWAIIR